MVKVLSWIAAGLVLGSVLTLVLRPSTDLESASDRSIADAELSAQDDAVVSAAELKALTERIAILEARVSALVSEVAQAGNQRRSDTAEDQVLSAQRSLSFGATQSSQSPDTVEQLVAAGFRRDRAEWISSRSEDFLMSLIEARYEAERQGNSLSAEEQARLSPEQQLRQELGDVEYERYLDALGRPTAVGVVSVIENSPAARAGLQSGDQIVSYGGSRVFNFLEVTELARVGTVGEPVLVDILRDGQPMQIVIPRGPLGAALSSNGLPNVVLVPSTQNQ